MIWLGSSLMAYFPPFALVLSLAACQMAKNRRVAGIALVISVMELIMLAFYIR